MKEYPFKVGDLIAPINNNYSITTKGVMKSAIVISEETALKEVKSEFSGVGHMWIMILELDEDCDPDRIRQRVGKVFGVSNNDSYFELYKKNKLQYQELYISA